MHRIELNRTIVRTMYSVHCTNRTIDLKLSNLNLEKTKIFFKQDLVIISTFRFD